MLTVHFLAFSRTRISCHAALDEAASAPFRKERRMKFAKATKFHRKSGGGAVRNSCPAQSPPAWVVNQSVCTEVHAFLLTPRDAN